MEFKPYMNLDKYVANLSGMGGKSGRTSAPDTNGATIKYKSRDQAIMELRSKLRRILASRNETIANVSSYTDVYNSWRNSLPPASESICSRTVAGDGEQRLWEVTRSIGIPTAEGVVKYNNTSFSPVLKAAQEHVCKSILIDVVSVDIQMDNVPSKESVQGDATQESSKESNTIVTRDQSITESCPQQHETTTSLASSEPTMSFDYLVGRWMPLKTLRVSTNQQRDHLLASYFVPETFLSSLSKCAPNTIPFETFVYGSYDYEFKFVVNANKFQCGKVIVSVKFDSYQADDIQKGFQAHLCRPHVILDLSANNEGVLSVPFRYHRAFVRNLTHNTATAGIRPGKFATVYVSVLSPLRTGIGGANDMDIRPFYMIRRADFAGMSYKVPLTQMDNIDTLAQALPTKSLKAVLKGVEATLDQLGKSHNQDKPTDLRSIVVVPKPRSHFPNGKGVSDASVMRMNPHALTSYNHVRRYDDDPKTTLDIAHIWGLRSTFTWANSQSEGVELFNTILDPTARSYSEDYVGQPTPLEYVCSFYQFWSGPIELRFDFVSNAFHTGSVIISAEYNRTSTTTDECQSHSTYTKTFHLGDQKSVMFRVPYIYDTIWRRSTGMVFNAAIEGQTTSDDIKSAAISIRPESRMRVKVRVLNALRPVSTTTSTIDVLVFMRGSKTFAVHSLKQSDMREDRDVVPIDSFPSDGYAPVKPDSKTKRSTGEVSETGTSYQATAKDRYLPANLANKWNEYKPVVQMDTGAKEDEDKTDNFALGHSALTAQSLDSQVGIKDILRRPVLIFNNKKCLATHTGYFVPLMPPSRMMQYVVGKETDFVKTVGQTPQAAIMNLFRFWRGGMRYTIIVHKRTQQAPIYLTHIPHSGSRLFGNKRVNTIVDKSIPIYGSGLTTEILIPQVNPTICVELPYDSENNWTLTFDEDALRNYAWRDKGDTNCGHLVLSSSEDFNFSVWWSAGDDFEVANFYGIPAMRSNSWAYQWSDEHARVQMDDNQDFQSNNMWTPVHMFKTIKEAMTPKLLVKSAICAMPVVGSAYTAANALNIAESAKNKIYETADDMAIKTQNTMDRLVETFGISLSSLTDMISTSVNKVVKGLDMATNIASYCYDIILDVLIAWIDKSWTAVGVSIVRFVGKTLVGSAVTSLMQYGLRLGEIIAALARPREVEVQAPNRDHATTLIGVLAGVVGTAIGVRVNMYRYTSMFNGIITRLTEAGGMSYLVNVLRFVDSTFVVIKETILNALGYVTPEAMALKMLSSSSEVLNSFVTEAQVVTCEANSNLMLDPGFRQRFWRTVMQAYQIQKLLATVPSSSASPVLGKLCNDVIKAGNEKFVDISAAPVRYEPFVICIEGAAGIGKSELVDNLAASLLAQINFTRPHSGTTYYRMPGSKFWSGYRDQPIVVYDDWLNLTDPMAAAQQLTELYQLKSTSLFIPEMAHLEEKKIRGNPLIVILLCNNAFPSSVVGNLVSMSEAVYRRRDVLLKASKKSEFEGISPRDMTIEQQTTFAHLEFRKYKSSVDSHSLSRKPIDYAETREYLEARFQRWHTQEQIKVKRRLDNTFAGMAGAPVSDLRIEDPFQLYYSVSASVSSDPANSQNGFLPSEVLAAEVARIATVVHTFQNTAPEQPCVPPMPVDIFEVTTQGPLSGLITNLVATKTFIKSALSWSSSKLEHWMQTTFKVTRGMRGQCVICMEEKPIFGRCDNSTESTPHIVCQDCVALQSRHRGHTACPMCRSDTMRFLDLEDVARSLGVFSLVAFKVGKTMKQVGDGLLSYFDGDFGDCYTLLYRAIVLLGTLYATDTTIDDISTSASAVFACDAILDRLRHPHTQIDDPFEEESDSSGDEAEEVETFVCEIDSDVIDDLLSDRTHQEVCGHRWLRGQEHRVEYHTGKFKILHEGGMVCVPENPCYHTLCPFADESSLRQFYTTYLREKSPVLKSHLRAFYNATNSTTETRKFYVDRVPKAVRPRWMRISPEIQQEVAVLSSPTWWESLGAFYDRYKVLIFSLAGVSAAVGGILTIQSLMTTTTPQTQYNDQYDGARTHRIRQGVRALQRPRPNRPHFQSTEGETPTLGDTVKRYIARNYITITLRLNEKTRLLTACGLYNRVALLPRHYVKEIRRQYLEGATIEVGPALLIHEHKPYTFDEVDFVCSDVTDLAIWTLPPSFGLFKDIRKFFAKDEDLERAITTNGELLIAPCRRTPNLTAVPVEIKGVQGTEVVRDVDGEKFEAHDVIVYDYSLPGACGSMLLLERTTRPIVAMHFAGIGTEKQGEGFGVILTQESIGEIATQICATQMAEGDYGDIEDAKIILGDANVSYMGVVPPERTVFLPRKSKIRPSLVHGRGNLSPLTQPCILDKTDPRYTHDITPLVAGCMKHGQLTRDFPSSVVGRAAERLWDGWLSKMKPIVSNPVRLTYEEAVSGLPGVEFYDPISVSTSAGFPWCTTPKKCKSDYIDIQRDDEGNILGVVISEEVVKVLGTKETQRRTGIVPFTPFVDTLKDERRKPEKLLKLGGTRVFCNPPLDYVIAMRQNFLHFTAAFVAQRFELQHAVGINVNGTEWTQLARNLIKVSPNNVCTIDYSNFGPGFNAGVAQAAMKLMIRWVKENVDGVDELELTCLLEECLNSQHLCVNTLYYQKCGSPSGAPITTIINTLVNELLILIAWDLLMANNLPEGSFAVEEYKRNVALFCYGDDLIMSVSDAIKDKFNAKTITECFSKYDIVATDASKTSEVVPYTTIEGASFLKMGFAKHEKYPHLWQSQLDWTSINDATQWVWECPDYKEATYENCKAALLQAHGHGKVKFEAFKSDVNRALISANCNPIPITWEEIDQLFYPDTIF